MDRATGRIGDGDRKVICLLKAKGDLLGTFSPRPDLGKTKRRKRAAIELAAAREIAHSNADMVDNDPTSWHNSRLYRQPCSGTEMARDKGRDLDVGQTDAAKEPGAYSWFARLGCGRT